MPPRSLLGCLMVCLFGNLCGALPTRSEAQTVVFSRARDFSSSDVLVVVIASRKRHTYKFQQQTWLSHFPSITVTELDTPHCKICGSFKGDTPYNGQLFENGHMRWANMSVDWYCAQQRPIQALQHVLQQTDTLPPWLLIVDDDTFVHPWNLLNMMSSESLTPDQPVTVGADLAGGAGFLLSRATLQRLIQPVMAADLEWDDASLSWRRMESTHTLLDACVHRVMGGQWCYLHSDHLMVRCARSAGVRMVGSSEMRQFCPVGTKIYVSGSGFPPNPIRNVSSTDASTQEWLIQGMVSCHYMDEESMTSIYGHITTDEAQQLIATPRPPPPPSRPSQQPRQPPVSRPASQISVQLIKRVAAASQRTWDIKGQGEAGGKDNGRAHHDAAASTKSASTKSLVLRLQQIQRNKRFNSARLSERRADGHQEEHDSIVT